jgi:meso-butanediol dehydrogenase/(S,S)-butanediol dehydrogenase/diacetyl reductase
MRLEGRVVVVTGAGRGIGAEISALFAQEGAIVVAADQDEEAAGAIAEKIRAAGGEATGHTVDVGDASQVEALVTAAAERYGKLDVMVNNAGIAEGGLLAELGEAVWERVLRVNLTGVFYGCKYAWPHLATTRGAIVNVASLGGIKAAPGFAAYGASKAGVIQLTQVAAIEGARLGIRANCVCPTWTETAMFEGSLARRPDPEALRERLRASVPLGRLGQPRDVACAVLYLASEEASFVTGVALPVDGGSLASL